ncbi:unnamed protein product [Nesidiocoris tenuis]|uniref:methionyl-tRNA formyltransferase n=1 Tax=Nesidiocoris tenuis TaxID=355587 RepID=A0A6H5G1D9_9HEMI|nr:unnamed protein product [Nesidiocoris tenuis]
MIRSFPGKLFTAFESVIFIPVRNLSLGSSDCQKCSKKPRPLEPPWKILFFGNDYFSLESLKPLYAKFCLEVVTSDKSLVKKFCEHENLLVHNWPLNPSSIAGKFHVGMVVSFGHMLPKSVIDSFPLGCINVHSSILPKYRGAAPIAHAIMNGDFETGVTIMKIHPHRFDVGDIVRQYRVSISPEETSQELGQRLAVCGGQLLMECLRDMPKCLQMTVPQPSDGVSYAPKLTPSMAKIDWQKSNARHVYNMHRALSHFFPLVTTWHGTILKLLDVRLDHKTRNADTDSSSKISNPMAEVDASVSRKSALDFLNSDSSCRNEQSHSRSSTNAGHVQFLRSVNVLKISCRDDNVVVVNRMKINGKTISASDFFNGYMSKRPKEQWRFGL